MALPTFWLCGVLALLVQVAARPDAPSFFFPKHHGLTITIGTVPPSTTPQNGEDSGNGAHGNGNSNGAQGSNNKGASEPRAICTNLLGNDGFPPDTDPCRNGESVWCCAGLVSNSEIKYPCTDQGPQGTRAPCASPTPMRFCCPLSRPPVIKPENIIIQNPRNIRIPDNGNKGGDAPQGDFQNAILKAHNKKRAAHNTPPLEWSSVLAGHAQKEADSCPTGGQIHVNSKAVNEGENYSSWSPPLPAAQAAEDAVERWYNKELGPYQGLSPKRFTEETGHVTQILWKGTRRLGCGFANCNNNGVVICRYDPPGNVQDQFDANVNA